MKIELTPFAKRHFTPGFKGTNLSRLDPEQVVTYAHSVSEDRIILDSQWEFCKYLVLPNPYKEVKQAVIPITLDIYPFIRTGYSSRTATELPVMTRWVELPPGFPMPQAKYLVYILYSYQQLKKEWEAETREDIFETEFYLQPDTEWGIVAIMGTIEPKPDPLVPITIMRNALGKEEGGNGEQLIHSVYKESVDFWEKHIIVKS
jgi:hypothetical protein